MTYAQAMRHRPHKLRMGHTFNTSGIQYAAPSESEARERCPGCGKKYARSTIRWVLVTAPDMERVCGRCINRMVQP